MFELIITYSGKGQQVKQFATLNNLLKCVDILTTVKTWENASVRVGGKIWANFRPNLYVENKAFSCLLCEPVVKTCLSKALLRKWLRERNFKEITSTFFLQD